VSDASLNREIRKIAADFSKALTGRLQPPKADPKPSRTRLTDRAAAGAKVGPRHMFIPDTQIKPGVPTDHLLWAARYAATKLPETIVIAGDWYDMHSLSSYDRGKLSGEGARYEDDIEAGAEGLRLFEHELAKYAPRSYKPRKVVTLGNHENRIVRAIEEDPRMEGKVSLNDLAFKEYGWQVRAFLKPVEIDSIVYSHYFPLNANGRVSNGRNGCPSALAQVRRVMKSCVAGHRQGFDYSLLHTPFATYRGVIVGSFYQHQENYLTACGENYWMGILIFNDVNVKTGEFSMMEIDMNFLRRRFG